MSVWGKLLVGGAGLVLGGPLGAVLGLAVGHGVDKIRKIDRSSQIGSNKKIKTLLNYKPKYKLEDSIKNILKNFRK